MTRPLPFEYPRGLSRTEAARYVGVSPSTFDKLIVDGAMPKPKQIRARRVWDRMALDLAFNSLDGGSDDEPNPWDE
jgi:predicted DNA-binding transcriptional regulator AlpA